MNTSITRQTNKDSNRNEIKGARLTVITSSPSINQSRLPMTKGQSFETLDQAVTFLTSKAPDSLFQIKATIWVMEGARIIDQVDVTLDNFQWSGNFKEYNGVITPFGPTASNQGQVNPTGNGKHFQIQARGDQHAAWLLHLEATKGSDKRPLMLSNMRHCR